MLRHSGTSAAKDRPGLRAGAYGGPDAVPSDVWLALYGIDSVDGLTVDGTGYTHRWRECDQSLRDVLMASVQSYSEGLDAVAMGWRYYRVDLEAAGPLAGEIACPHEERGVQCSDCLLCDGSRKKAKNIVIPLAMAGSERCYVQTFRAPLAVWKSWERGNVPAVSPEEIRDYLLGKSDSMPATVEAWRGPSLVDGSPVVLLLSGLSSDSTNPKTGPMAQSWILRADMPPHVAVKTGADEAVCGKCPLRPALAMGDGGKS
jgi:hypothetical protein